MQISITGVRAKRILFWLDETEIGRITLVNVEQQVGTRDFRDAVIAFSEGVCAVMIHMFLLHRSNIYQTLRRLY